MPCVIGKDDGSVCLSTNRCYYPVGEAFRFSYPDLIMLFDMCVTFNHDLCCIRLNFVYFIHLNRPQHYRQHTFYGRITLFDHWDDVTCPFFWLCGMWLCATNLHIVTHISCNDMHCQLCWFHVPHGMHDTHVPRR